MNKKEELSKLYEELDELECDYNYQEEKLRNIEYVIDELKENISKIENNS